MRLSGDRPKQLVLHGKEIRLTPSEYRLLRWLADPPRRVCSLSDLYRAVYGLDVVEVQQIAWHIHRLREKGVPIQTISRRGYYLDLPGNEIVIEDSEHNCGNVDW